uniref:Late endosomal/lysosomal adaptor and MAPK and MTOR activator-domain-containing protein n=1 Tax=Bionectria ochroleuca TaxID=29856 RepID=A0A0B7K4T1_BIOOC
MGVCQSCLGRRDRDGLREDEETALIYEEEHGVNYGSFGEHDSNEVQRENEAIQSVVAKTSNNMVDVFEITPHLGASNGPSAHFAYTGQGARLARYQRLVSKLNTQEATPPADVKVDWLLDDDAADPDRNRPASLTTVEGDEGALVGTFADAAAAAATTSKAIK